MGIVDRIKLFVVYKGITINKFEIMSGLTRGSLRYIKSSIGSDKLAGVIKAFPELNMDWLIAEVGDMIKDTGDSNIFDGDKEVDKTENLEESTKIILGLSKTIAYQQNHISELANTIEKMRVILKSNGLEIAV